MNSPGIRKVDAGQEYNQIEPLLNYGECMEHNTNRQETGVRLSNSKLKKYKLKNRNI